MNFNVTYCIPAQKPSLNPKPPRSGWNRFPFRKSCMVWARVGKRDWWPGTITEVRDDGKYIVTYYPPYRQTTPPIPYKNIEFYTESDHAHLMKRCSRMPNSKMFHDTVANAREAYKRNRHNI